MSHDAWTMFGVGLLVGFLIAHAIHLALRKP